MGQGTKISWAENTFNPWEGCERVSAACKNCYAARRDSWLHRGAHWGPGSTRRRTSDANWRRPRRWNAALEGTGRRERVFCASLADVFEDRPELEAWRADLWELIRQTPNPDWLVLTKRPENIARMLPDDWGDGWPNVWLGTTVENQATADERIPHLLRVSARVRFLSCEPLLGPVDLTSMVREAYDMNPLRGTSVDLDDGTDGLCARVHWVIAGGESGPNARPSHPDWFRSLRDQCEDAGVAFHLKQHGEWAPDCRCGRSKPCATTPRPEPGRSGVMFRCGKRAAGRELDGRTWDAVP